MFNIGESLDRMFKSATEQIYPVLNNLDNVLKGFPFNPFDSFDGIYILFGILVSFFVVLFGIIHILSNINRLSNKATLKKAILIIVFLLATIGIMLNMPGKEDYKTFDLSLIYYYGDKSTSGGTELETGYKHLAKESEYVNPFRDNLTNDSLYINIKDVFGEPSNLSSLYKDEEELNYKSFLVGIKGMYGPYSEIGITNGYISNLDLLGLNITEDLNLGVEDESIEDGLKKLPSEKTFTENGFNYFMNLIKYEITDDKNKNNITDVETPFASPIKWNGDTYKYIGAFQATDARIDIMLESIEQEDGSYKYIVLPYYDFISILSDGYQTLGITGLFDSGLEKTEEESKTTNEGKLLYTQINKKLKLLSEDIYKEVDEETDYTDASKFTSSGFQIDGVNTAKLEYYIKYNKDKKYDNIYSTDEVINDYIDRFKLLIKKLEILENNNKKLDLYKLQNKSNTTDKYLKELEGLDKTLSDAQDEIYIEYESYLSNKISDDIIADVNAFYALNLSTIAYSLTEFQLLGEGDKYKQLDKQKTHISLLLSILENGTNLLNDKETSLLNILDSIDILDNKEDNITIKNKEDIILYNLYSFISLKDEFTFEKAIDEKLLLSICENGEYTERIKTLNAQLNLGLDNTTVDCSLNNGDGEITNNENFKKLGYKLIELYKAQDLREEVSLIPYFALLKEDSGNSNIFYNSFSNVDDEDGANYFMTEKVHFGSYKFVSPLIYYKYLLTQKFDKIPGIFINLIDMKGKVQTEAGVFDMKLGSPVSWYNHLDSVNGEKYSDYLYIGIPLSPTIVMGVLWLINQFFILGIYAFVFTSYLILLKSE